MNPVRVFPIKFNESQQQSNNQQSSASSPLLKKKQVQQQPSERSNVINMSPVINGQQQNKSKMQLKRYQTISNGIQDDKVKIIQQQRLSQGQPISYSPKKRVISSNYQEVPSPTKLPNLKKAENTSSQDILQKIDLGLAQKRSKRTDASNEVTPSSRAQIIKLLQDTSPKQKVNNSRAKVESQTIDQDTSIKPRMPQQMVMLHGRSTSQATLVNNQTNEYEMQDYVQLFFSKSQAGQNGNGQTKTNQDSVIITNNLGGIKNRYIFSVCDGHGVYGHYVSQLVKRVLPTIIDQQIKTFIGKQEQDISENYEQEIHKVLNSSFNKMTKDLSNSGIDITFSGTTCSLVFLSGPHLWCANIGDSRSIFIEQQNFNKWHLVELSNDHKPDLPSEFKRIISNRGRVEPYITEIGEKIGPARVWLQHEQIPGLAMSRSFGDYVASTVGVSSEPEIIHHKMDANCAFLVVASDGVWEFFSNEEIQKIVISHWSPNMTAKKIDEICDIIVRESTKRWQEEDEVIDDISIVIAYLHRQ
ncbi:unnamed protein product [Paramecium octaurelia]|uniref:PPM-type phosphatase domain-containing protein n=1 Tax=Paramecium octaurelia TaxID=43137 RepID=A0A8S1SIN5_PAROT|nr:unnamed protein product [Paramecium octaurelia]